MALTPTCESRQSLHGQGVCHETLWQGVASSLPAHCVWQERDFVTESLSRTIQETPCPHLKFGNGPESHRKQWKAKEATLLQGASVFPVSWTKTSVFSCVLLLHYSADRDSKPGFGHFGCPCSSFSGQSLKKQGEMYIVTTMELDQLPVNPIVSRSKDCRVEKKNVFRISSK